MRNDWQHMEGFLTGHLLFGFAKHKLFYYHFRDSAKYFTISDFENIPKRIHWNVRLPDASVGLCYNELGGSMPSFNELPFIKGGMDIVFKKCTNRNNPTEQYAYQYLPLNHPHYVRFRDEFTTTFNTMPLTFNDDNCRVYDFYFRAVSRSTRVIGFIIVSNHDLLNLRVRWKIIDKMAEYENKPCKVIPVLPGVTMLSFHSFVKDLKSFKTYCFSSRFRRHHFAFEENYDVAYDFLFSSRNNVEEVKILPIC